MSACVGCLDLTPCQNCHTGLVVHQPDPDLPGRLIGTCDECKAWFLIDAAEGVIVPLPCEELLGQASGGSVGP